MLTTAVKRHFSSSNGNLNKTVCILANSKQGDIVGQRIMQSLKSVSGVEDFDFFGYGGKAMAREGMAGQVEVDLDDFNGKSNQGGTLGDDYLPSGTYFYVIDYKNGEKPVSGYIEFVR
jgi:hypothetical protein